MEKGVVLGGGQRQFRHSMGQGVRQHGAAATGLRLQARDSGNRHIVGEFQFRQPVDVSIHDGRSKTSGTEQLRVLIYFSRSFQKCGSILEEIPVVI